MTNKFFVKKIKSIILFTLFLFFIYFFFTTYGIIHDLECKSEDNHNCDKCYICLNLELAKTNKLFCGNGDIDIGRIGFLFFICLILKKVIQVNIDTSLIFLKTRLDR